MRCPYDFTFGIEYNRYRQCGRWRCVGRTHERCRDRTMAFNVLAAEAERGKGRNQMLELSKISDDLGEMEHVFIQHILLELIQLSNRYGNYDQAIREIEAKLKNLIVAKPSERRFIKRCADRAGELFVAKVGRAKVAAAIKRANEPADIIDIPLKARVIQHPPDRPIVIGSGDRTRDNAGLGVRCGER